jgi:hypothetical protein
MRYVLKADNRFVQSSDQRLTCSLNQFITWWEGMAYEKPPILLSIHDTRTDTMVAEANFKAGSVLRWRMKKR